VGAGRRAAGGGASAPEEVAVGVEGGRDAHPWHEALGDREEQAPVPGEPRARLRAREEERGGVLGVRGRAPGGAGARLRPLHRASGTGLGLALSISCTLASAGIRCLRGSVGAWRFGSPAAWLVRLLGLCRPRTALPARLLPRSFLTPPPRTHGSLSPFWGCSRRRPHRYQGRGDCGRDIFPKIDARAESSASEMAVVTPASDQPPPRKRSPRGTASEPSPAPAYPGEMASLAPRGN